MHDMVLSLLPQLTITPSPACVSISTPAGNTEIFNQTCGGEFGEGDPEVRGFWCFGRILHQYDIYSLQMFASGSVDWLDAAGSALCQNNNANKIKAKSCSHSHARHLTSDVVL